MRIEKLDDSRIVLVASFTAKDYIFVLEEEFIQQLRELILGEVAFPEESMLLPCPFCGGDASLGSGVGYTFVNCPDCGISNNTIADMTKFKREHAIDHWNTRVK